MTIPDPTPGRRAVLILEYEVADDAPMGALSEAWGATLKAVPEVEGVRHVNTHAATREAAESRRSWATGRSRPTSPDPK